MDAKHSTITVEQLAAIVHRRLGLIIGPGATLATGAMRRVERAVWRNLATDSEKDEAGNFADLLRAGVTAASIREQVVAEIAKEQTQPFVAGIASQRWAAVISTAIDTRFEADLRVWSDGQPNRPDISVITDMRSQFAPARTTPVYKMFGSVFGDFAITSVEQRIRLARLIPTLRAFADYVRGAGVLCLGLGEEPHLLADFFAPMIADSSLSPGPIIFLDGDPGSNCSSLVELEQNGLRVHRVHGEVGPLLKAIGLHAKAGYTNFLPFSSAAMPLSDHLQPFVDLAVLVPSGDANDEQKVNGEKQINHLREALFSPAIPNWEPFAANLDFRRTITDTILEKIRGTLKSSYWSDFEIRVDGASAVGKTTTLKRVAFDLAKEGQIVLWLKHYVFQDGPSVVRNLFSTLKTRIKSGTVVVFADDPLGLGTIRLDDVRAAIKSADLQGILITGIRTIDLAAGEPDLDDDSEFAVDSIAIPDVFDDVEWKSLPNYLVNLGVHKNLEDAVADVTNAPGRAARDVLSMLYYLLPETRSKITKSVQQEYLQLGDRNSLRNLVIGELNESAMLVKRSYELIAVATKYRAPLPMEVLVSTLNVNYDEWLAASEGDGLTFGLFYQERSEESETVVYRARNDVVSDIVVTAVNGGIGVRGGEIKLLKSLLSACNGTAPAYRDFCLRVLVPPREAGEPKPPIVRLDHNERLSLFEAALAALPAEDPTLLHHLGLWQGKAGDTVKARETLDRALKARPYPYSSRGEAPEHIHTSHASNELRAIRNGEIDPVQGRMNALHHLERASSSRFFNPNAIHQRALLVAELADLSMSSTGIEDADWFDMIGWALSDLDRGILQLSSDYASETDRESIEMLSQARESVINRTVHLGDATEAAEELWKQHASQEGFAVVARRLFGIAMDAGSKSGPSFKRAFDYCQECMAKVLRAKTEPAASLTEATLHIYLQWQVKRRVMSAGTSDINWELIRSMADRSVKSARTLDQPFYHYLIALALSHLGKWPEANVIFQDLRRRPMSLPVLHAPRDFLMNSKGGMRLVQGVVTSVGFERFVRVEELQTDFRTVRVGTWPNDGEICGVYIRFSFAGPLAVDEA